MAAINIPNYPPGVSDDDFYEEDELERERREQKAEQDLDCYLEKELFEFGGQS